MKVIQKGLWILRLTPVIHSYARIASQNTGHAFINAIAVGRSLIWDPFFLAGINITASQHKTNGLLVLKFLFRISVKVSFSAHPMFESKSSATMDFTTSLNWQPCISHDESITCSTSSDVEIFPFLSLPIEIRLQIYSLLLPPRTHTIVTQIPYTGYFFNTSIPGHPFALPSHYPFGRSPPTAAPTYKILTTNTHLSFPQPSIYPSILRVSRQILAEAEPVLYGGKHVRWDFGIHLEALRAFWQVRSRVARECVRSIRVAKEISCVENRNGVLASVDTKWEEFCQFVKDDLPGLRMLDLTIWSTSGLTSSFPPAPLSQAGKEDEVEQWREWEWTRDLLRLENLIETKITSWGFQNIRDETNFDSWLAGRMVSEKLVRERMVREGVVVEGVAVLEGMARAR